MNNSTHQSLELGHFTSDPQLKCDLCTDSEVAVTHCDACMCYLCEFCHQAHRRQTRTSQHPLVPLSAVHGSSRRQQSKKKQRQEDGHAMSCDQHEGQRLSLYCNSCVVPICQECTVDNHFNHTFVMLEDAKLQYSDTMHDLLMQAQPLVSTLNDSLQNIELLISGIREKADGVAQSIYESIDARIYALQEHKRMLVSELQEAVHHKENTLRMQFQTLSQSVQEVQELCVDGSRALQKSESDCDGFTTSDFSIVQQLKDTLLAEHECQPQEDDYLQFFPDASAGHCNGFEVFGVVDPHGPSPLHSVVEGEGIFTAQQRKMAAFKVTLYNRYGQRKKMGGDKLEAYMCSVGNAGVVSTSITDNKDGSYQVAYTAERAGEHRLSVTINGMHLQRSPFTVDVVPRRKKKHRGIYHCCTFCSSEGKKHIRCGCGSVMPGGYSGCGHGHPGHPGRSHWSCCGSTTKNSECTL